MIYLKFQQTFYVIKEFSRPNKVRLNGMASEILKISANFLRNRKEFSRPNEVLLNGMASDLLKISSNFLRNRKRI